MGTDVHDEFLAATLPALDLVYNLSRRLGRNRESVEDLVQETYVKAFEAWSKGRKPQQVEPWIATICLNAGRSMWRKASTRREIVTEERSDEPSQVDVAEEAMQSLRKDAVHEALWMLPDEQRIAITLMDLDGFTAVEAARITGAPRGTILSRVHRGRKKLATLLDRKVSNHEA
ncbi:MAG: RNA polymerase sigma factor [Actinomycetota bacterium]